MGRIEERLNMYICIICNVCSWLCVYVWVGVCHIHSFFGDNQYPDEAKREEIAAACNAVIQKPGRKKHNYDSDFITHYNGWLLVNLPLIVPLALST